MGGGVTGGNGPVRQRFKRFMLGEPERVALPPDAQLEVFKHDRVGVCCSGGGVRSAAFNLGALQVLQDEGELDDAAYLSAVSGGAYIAAARSIVQTQTEDQTLFATVKPYAAGSPEAKWLRNNSSYIAPGTVGKLRLLLTLLTGMGVNVALSGLFLYLVARPLGWAYGRWLIPDVPWQGANPIRTIPGELWAVALIPAAVGAVFALLGLLFRPKASVQTFLTAWAGRLATLAAIPFVLLVVLPYLTLLLRNGLPDFDGYLNVLFPAGVGETGAAVKTPGIPGVVWPAIGSLAVAAGRLLWARKRAFVALTFASIVGPLTIAFAFVWFINGGIAHRQSDVTMWASLLAVFVIVYLFSDLTNWSGHPFYKRRLADAYVVRRLSNDDVEPVPYSTLLQLSSSQPARKPTLVVCAAANVSNRGLTPPGRYATTFTFEAVRVGGALGDYVETAKLENVLGRRKRDMTLLAAVAMSGAAASPSMGKLSIPQLRFLLGILNIRLGVWVPNPRWADRWTATRPDGLRRYERPRLHYLVKELFGLNDVNDKFLYVTDGGHFENLGLVELLRRGCTKIYCFDASGEQDDTFFTLGQAVAIARADLNVEIDIDPSPICEDDPDDCKPEDRLNSTDHVEGTFTYAKPDGSTGHGTLVYARTAVTKHAPYEVRAYRSRDSKFPHHPTLDQLFNDEKFESYWSLGRDTAKNAIKTMRGEP